MEPQCCAPQYTRSPPQSVRDDLALGRGEGACGEAIQRPTATEPIVDGPAVDVEPAIGLRLSAQGWACGAEGAESLSGGRGVGVGGGGGKGGRRETAGACVRMLGRRGCARDLLLHLRVHHLLRGLLVGLLAALGVAPTCVPRGRRLRVRGSGSGRQA